MKKVNIFNYSYRRMLCLLVVLLTVSTASVAELRKRVLFSQDYEKAQAVDWQSDPEATLSLVSDPVNGTCVQIEATEGNVGVWLPIELPDEVFYRDQYMSNRGYVVEFDFMIRSGNVADVSQSQLIVQTQGTYPYHGGDLIEPEYYGLNEGGAPVSKWSSFVGASLSQPVRTESTYSTEWFMSYSNQGSSKVFESDKWYHFSAHPEYVEEGQFPGFWFEYAIREKDTGTWIYGGGSSTDGLARLTGISALVGQGGMLKFDNLWVYDYKNYDQPVFELVEMNGASRTYVVTNPNYDSSTLYYTNQLLDEQPPYGDAAYIRSSNKQSSWITVTGTGNLYAYVASGDNDPTPSAVTVQSVSADIQTLMPPFHYANGYDDETNMCWAVLDSDQSWLEYAGDDMPYPDIYYAIDDGEFQKFDPDKEKEIAVPLGSQLKYYASLDGYNDSPTVTVTASIPFWMLGVQNERWWDSYDGWDIVDKTPVVLGEQVEDGLFPMTAMSTYGYLTPIGEHLLTPDENINPNFMMRNYSPNGKVAPKTSRKAPSHEQRRAKPARVIKKSRNIDEWEIHGIYSGDVRTYAVPEVTEGGYLRVWVTAVENRPVVTAVDGVEVDEWSTDMMPDGAFFYLKVTATGTVRFAVNDGTALNNLVYFEASEPEPPSFYPQSVDGANRTYNIYSQAASSLYYTTVPAAEQPALDSDAWTSSAGSYVTVTTTGQGYIYAYGTNALGTSEVDSVYVNGVALTLAPPVIRSKSQDYDTKAWTVTLYNPMNYIDGFYTKAKIFYSIDGGEAAQYKKDAITVANGSQLSFYTEAPGFTSSPTVTVTAADPLNTGDLEYMWNDYYYSWYDQPVTLGEEVESPEGFYHLNAGDGNLLTPDENINDQFQLKYYGIFSPVPRTYAVAGLNTDQYLYIYTNDEKEHAVITPVEGLEYDGWNSDYSTQVFKVTTNGPVKFRINGNCYLRQLYLWQEPQYGYVNVADANGNTLKYYYENATSDAQFYGVTEYAEDETKAGHVIIADKVTDSKGREHNVTSIYSSMSNKSNLKSVVFGQNITTVGNSAFYNCQQLESVTLNSKLETLGTYTFEYCYKLSTVNFDEAPLLTTVPEGCFYQAGLTEINIPATITELGSSAFYGCDSAVVVTVNVAEIPANCFQPNNSDESKLQTINIGKDVKSIGNNAFRYQRQVTAVNIDPEVSELAIGNYAFSDLDAVTTITLPKGVASLGTGVFSYCDNLTTVIFDEASTIEAIPQSCFYECKSLEKLTFPNSVKTIGYSAFYNCTNLRELTFGTGLEANGFAQDNWNYGYLFSNCTSMEKMTLPGVNFPFQCQYSGLPTSMTLYVNAEAIDDYKGSSYTNIYHIVPIGATTDFVINLTEAGTLTAELPSAKAGNAITLTVSGKINGTDVNWIHQGMPYLQELILTNAQIVEGGEAVKCYYVENGVVQEDPWNGTYTVKKDEVCDYMFYNMPALKHIALPNGVKRIGKYALSCNYNSQLVQVDLPIALTAIDDNAFQSDSKLSKADLPAGLLTIGQSAFYETAITSVTIPEGVKSLGNSAFYDCEQLKTVVLPDGLETIGKSAFNSCDNLESVNIPKQVVTIVDNAFANCYKLQSPIVIPAGCQSIGSSAFSGDSQIPSVTFSDEAVGDRFVNLTAAMWNSQWGCDYTLFQSSALPFGHGSVPMDNYADLSAYDRLEVTVSEGTPRFCFNRQTTDGQDTNDGVGSEMIDIPGKTWGTQKYQTKKGDNTYVIDLKQIVADQGHAYLHCIKEAQWGAGVTVTAMRLYTENTQTEGTALTTIGSNAFNSCSLLEQVTLPESVTSLGSSAFSNCSSLKSFAFPANIKQVPYSVLENCESLESVTLAEGTTQIGGEAFYNCSKMATINLNGQPLTRIDDYAFYNTGLTSVTLPESLTSMGYYVFYNCTKLESANIPSQIKTVPSSTFSGCTSLTSVTLHDGITKIESSAFSDCKLLPGIALTDQVTSIGSSAFSGCEALEIEALPTSLKTIGSSAFKNTKAMNITLTIPETVTSLESDAFRGSGLTGVVFTKKPNSFSTNVFYECKQLASVTLPADMTTIPNYTFYGCSALKSIDLPLTLTKIGDYAFSKSGLETISLPQKLQSIGSCAFYGTQLTEIRVPKNVTTVGSYFAANNPKLKTAYLGRKQNYTNNSYFDYFAGCDNLELLRVYAGTTPNISSGYRYSQWNGSSNDYYLYYTKYRTNCVLEVPEGTVDIYEAANIWTDFKEIRVFESDDMMNDLDFAVMKDLYKYLNGASWEKPWDLTNQNHSIGKWKGITTEADAEDDELFYITGIDLTGQGLVGPLPKSLFTLERLKTLNMSHNTVEALVDTLIAEEYTPLTELNMEGNHLKGDLYPLVSKLPNLTKLNVSYNWLTAYSHSTSNAKLSNSNMYRGFQFVDWTTKKAVVPEELEDEVVIDFTPGTPIDIQSNTLQVYRHEKPDYNLSFDYLYPLSGTSYNSEGMLQKKSGLWDVYNSYVFKGKKGELVAYTHTNPYYSYITYIFRFDWKDGDVNADQTIDVADLQNVVYYALNDKSPSNQMYNYTAADLNSDSKINVSDIVGCVDLVLESTEPEATGARMYNKVEGESRNVMTATANSILLANADEVAALQLTVSGANAAQLQLNSDLRSRFSVSMRDVSDGVRIVVYSPMGNTLAPGEHQLLSGLPAGATVTDVRLVDSEAQRLSVRVFGSTTAIDELMADDMDLETMPIYDLSGRRVGKWNTLPRGIYIVNLNGKQFKVRK